MTNLKRVKSFLPPVGISIGGKHYLVSGGDWQEVEKPLTSKEIMKLWDRVLPAQTEFGSIKVNPTVQRFITQGSKGNKYTVQLKYGKWSCTCPAYGFGRGAECKHIKQIKNGKG